MKWIGLLLRLICWVMIAAIGLLGGGWNSAHSAEIKVALVTPDGSAWTQTLRNLAKEVSKRTAGELRFKIYSGGVMGDELDVLRKMRVNRVHAAGFSGVGLGVVLPEIRILEAPLLFESNEEIDFVKDRLYETFAEKFERKGYVLLGFAEAGFVYFFSKQSIAGGDALQSIKMWAWKGDPVAETFLTTFGIKTVPLHVADVNTGLETGMIDSFYSPPLAAVAFQWHARIDYMLDYPMVNSTGALLMTKRAFDRLPPAHQAVLKELARDYCRELVRITRNDNGEALEIFREDGIRFETPPPALISSFKENANKTYEKSMPKLYSRELFDQVRVLVDEFRSSR